VGLKKQAVRGLKKQAVRGLKKTSCAWALKNQLCVGLKRPGLDLCGNGDGNEH